MPIANFYFNEKFIEDQNAFENIMQDWSKNIETSPENITINVLSNKFQFGKKYKLMINLLLPSLWSNLEIEAIQLELAKLSSKHLAIPIQEIFVTTQIIQSGHVVEDGKIQKWYKI